MDRLRYSIAKDFSITPGARGRSEGPHSGEELLENLIPLVEEAKRRSTVLEIDLDGAAGYATSFLEAVFGGLVRELGRDSVEKCVRWKSDEEPYLADEIRRYIAEAGD